MPRPVIYFARMGSCVKIGHASDVRRRMGELCLPMSAVVGTLPGGAEREAQLHARFGESRIDGSEWFEITPALQKFLDGLGAARLRTEKRSEPVREVPERLVHDITETAVLLDTTEEAVRRLIAEEKLPVLVFGPRTIRISREEIESFSAARAAVRAAARA